MESIGGQAVIEGVMLRRRNAYSVAVRDPKGKIIVKKHRIKDHRKGLLSFFNIPFFRGMYAMYEMLTIGTKTLIYSSTIAAEEEDEKLSPRELFWVIFLSLAFTIGFFVILPYALTVLVGVKEHVRPVLFNIVDAIIKTALFIAYVWAISLMKDIKRVFEYHGAEHMVVHSHEHDKKVTVKTAAKYSPIHPRCGSSFIMLTIVISIIVFSLLPVFVYLWFPGLSALHFAWQKVILGVARIIFIPVVVGVSYEILKLAGKYPENPIMKFISLPGMWLQKLTTSKPNKKQIEVALAALNKLI